MTSRNIFPEKQPQPASGGIVPLPVMVRAGGPPTPLDAPAQGVGPRPSPRLTRGKEPAWHFPHPLVLLAALLCLGAGIAVACGPFFPWQLLDDRAAALKATPANSFTFEASHLMPAPTDSLHAVQAEYAGQEPSPDEARAKADAGDLTEPQLALIERMRTASDGDTAQAMGATLPPPMRLYTAGAVDFRAGRYPQAIARFAAVGTQRATWAAFMTGRAHAALGQNAQAAVAFARTRQLARDGAPDPLGLAVASYGEEARLHLNAAKDEAYAKELAAAAALYAEQAARGARSGADSLRMIAEGLLDPNPPTDDPTHLRAAVAVPIVQRLLVAYALNRIEDDPMPDRPDVADPGAATKSVMTALLAALEHAKIDHPAGADRLAALCYHIGRFDCAARYADQDKGPLAAWIQAKLALRRGDLPAATAAYAVASRAFPDAADALLDDAHRKLAVGEQGLLTLARGDYWGAMTQLYPVAATYWGDVVHLAERVLTVDELKRFVDALKPTAAKPKLPEDYALATDPPTQLRGLLGRRLVREGRLQEAAAYFPPDEKPDDTGHTTVYYLNAYAAALKDAADKWWNADKARAWFAAADLARWHGMETMGTEGPPDYFALEGNYETGVAQEKIEGEFVTTEERKRFAASAARPDHRFHYRYVAVEQATRAADLLPPKSQAFAAVLCHAASWMLDRDDAAGQVLYKRYVREGAHVPWATHFGRDCPAPDFDAAKRFRQDHAVGDIRHFVSRYRWPMVGFVVVLAIGAWRVFSPRHGRA